MARQAGTAAKRQECEDKLAESNADGIKAEELRREAARLDSDVAELQWEIDSIIE